MGDEITIAIGREDGSKPDHGIRKVGFVAAYSIRIVLILHDFPKKYPTHHSRFLDSLSRVPHS